MIGISIQPPRHRFEQVASPDHTILDHIERCRYCGTERRRSRFFVERYRYAGGIPARRVNYMHEGTSTSYREGPASAWSTKFIRCKGR